MFFNQEEFSAKSNPFTQIAHEHLILIELATSEFISHYSNIFSLNLQRFRVQNLKIILDNAPLK